MIRSASGKLFLQQTSSVYKKTSIQCSTCLSTISSHSTWWSLCLWVFTVNSTHSGHTIKESSSCKDLGIVFTNTLTWQEHYEMISAKAYQILGLLRRVFKNSQNLQTRKCLYLSLVWAKLLCCSPLWKPYLLKDIESLERVQWRATKFILSDYSSDYRTRLIKIGILP